MNSYVSLLCLSALLVTTTLPTSCRAAPVTDELSDFLCASITQGHFESMTDFVEMSLSMEAISPDNSFSKSLDELVWEVQSAGSPNQAEIRAILTRGLPHYRVTEAVKL